MSDIASTGRWGALAHRQQFHRLGVLARFCHVQCRLASLERLTPTHTRARSTVRGTHVAAKQPLATDGISKGDVCAELDELLQGIHVAVGRGNDERRLAALRNTQNTTSKGDGPGFTHALAPQHHVPVLGGQRWRLP